jgi:hypothetical protein
MWQIVTLSNELIYSLQITPSSRRSLQSLDYESCYAARHSRCFEADGLTQTQSSLTGQNLEEDKWMSGRSDRRTTGKDLKRSGS